MFGSRFDDSARCGDIDLLLQLPEPAANPADPNVRVLRMRAIKFEAVAKQHMLRLPEQVPDGVKLRAFLLLDYTESQQAASEAGIQPRRKPSPTLAGSVTMREDLLTPAVPERDWDALK